jgi:hypothetical protein
VREEPVADSVMQGLEPSDDCLLQSMLGCHEQPLGAKFIKKEKMVSILGALPLR